MPNRDAIAEALKGLTLVHGVGDESAHTACTIAAINLALTGKLTDDPNPCISEVIRRFVIALQDHMPEEILNSPEYREVIPLIAGSASTPERERDRLATILQWMWDRLGDEAVLALIPEEVKPAWNTMLRERTPEAATKARAAAWAAAWVAEAARAAAATAASWVARAAAWAAKAVAEAAATKAVAEAAWAAAATKAAEAAVVANAADSTIFWQRADVPKLLRELCKTEVVNA